MATGEGSAKDAIRDAAIELFGRYGPGSVSLRAVAARAGVSQPLIIKHYGSRENLETAVDEHVLDVLRRALEPLLSGEEVPERSISDLLTSTPAVRYFAHLLISGGPRADRAFASLHRFSTALVDRLDRAGMVAEGTDREHLATVLLVHDLSVALMRDRITAVLGEDPLGEAGLSRWRDLVGRLYTGTVLGPDRTA